MIMGDGQSHGWRDMRIGGDCCRPQSKPFDFEVMIKALEEKEKAESLRLTVYDNVKVMQDFRIRPSGTFKFDSTKKRWLLGYYDLDQNVLTGERLLEIGGESATIQLSALYYKCERCNQDLDALNHDSEAHKCEPDETAELMRKFKKWSIESRSLDTNPPTG